MSIVGRSRVVDAAAVGRMDRVEHRLVGGYHDGSWGEHSEEVVLGPRSWTVWMRSGAQRLPGNQVMILTNFNVELNYIQMYI